jgi:CheY-like chemotaxis protein
MGHEAYEARCGQEGLEIALAVPLDVALLDIGMPGMNGYELARLMRQQPALAKLTLVAITGYSQDYDRQESRKAGIDYHLVKPLDPPQLAKILDGLDCRIGGA